MTTSPLFVGVDVAKERLDVAVRPSGESWSVATDEARVAALVARLRTLAPALIVCEATGGFERAAIVALAADGAPSPLPDRAFLRRRGVILQHGRASGRLAYAILPVANRTAKRVTIPDRHAG